MGNANLAATVVPHGESSSRRHQTGTDTGDHYETMARNYRRGLSHRMRRLLPGAGEQHGHETTRGGGSQAGGDDHQTIEAKNGAPDWRRRRQSAFAGGTTSSGDTRATGVGGIGLSRGINQRQRRQQDEEDGEEKEEEDTGTSGWPSASPTTGPIGLGARRSSGPKVRREQGMARETIMEAQQVNDARNNPRSPRQHGPLPLRAAKRAVAVPGRVEGVGGGLHDKRTIGDGPAAVENGSDYGAHDDEDNSLARSASACSWSKHKMANQSAPKEATGASLLEEGESLECQASNCSQSSATNGLTATATNTTIEHPNGSASGRNQQQADRLAGRQSAGEPIITMEASADKTLSLGCSPSLGTGLEDQISVEKEDACASSKRTSMAATVAAAAGDKASFERPRSPPDGMVSSSSLSDADKLYHQARGLDLDPKQHKMNPRAGPAGDMATAPAHHDERARRRQSEQGERIKRFNLEKRSEANVNVNVKMKTKNMGPCQGLTGAGEDDRQHRQQPQQRGSADLSRLPRVVVVSGNGSVSGVGSSVGKRVTAASAAAATPAAAAVVGDLETATNDQTRTRASMSTRSYGEQKRYEGDDGDDDDGDEWRRAGRAKNDVEQDGRDNLVEKERDEAGRVTKNNKGRLMSVSSCGNGGGIGGIGIGSSGFGGQDSTAAETRAQNNLRRLQRQWQNRQQRHDGRQIGASPGTSQPATTTMTTLAGLNRSATSYYLVGAPPICSPAAGPSNFNMELARGGGGGGYSATTTTMTAMSTSLRHNQQQQWHLLEMDHNQRVRNWLESQPFTANLADDTSKGSPSELGASDSGPDLDGEEDDGDEDDDGDGDEDDKDKEDENENDGDEEDNDADEGEEDDYGKDEESKLTGRKPVPEVELLLDKQRRQSVANGEDQHHSEEQCGDDDEASPGIAKNNNIDCGPTSTRAGNGTSPAGPQVISDQEEDKQRPKQEAALEVRRLSEQAIEADEKSKTKKKSNQNIEQQTQTQTPRATEEGEEEEVKEEACEEANQDKDEGQIGESEGKNEDKGEEEEKRPDVCETSIDRPSIATEASLKIANQFANERRLRFMHNTSVDVYGCTTSSQSSPVKPATTTTTQTLPPSAEVALAHSGAAHRAASPKTCCLYSSVEQDGQDHSNHNDQDNQDVRQRRRQASAIGGSSGSCSNTMQPSDKGGTGPEPSSVGGDDDGRGEVESRSSMGRLVDNCSLCNYLISIREIASEHDELAAHSEADRRHLLFLQQRGRGGHTGAPMGDGITGSQGGGAGVKCRRCEDTRRDADARRGIVRGSPSSSPDAGKLADGAAQQLLDTSAASTLSAVIKRPNGDGATVAAKPVNTTTAEDPKPGREIGSPSPVSNLRPRPSELARTHLPKIDSAESQTGADQHLVTSGSGNVVAPSSSELPALLPIDNSNNNSSSAAGSWRAGRLARAGSLDEIARQRAELKSIQDEQLNRAHQDDESKENQIAKTSTGSTARVGPGIRRTRRLSQATNRSSAKRPGGSPLTGRLIVINANNVSYTIRVTTEQSAELQQQLEEQTRDCAGAADAITNTTSTKSSVAGACSERPNRPNQPKSIGEENRGQPSREATGSFQSPNVRSSLLSSTTAPGSTKGLDNGGQQQAAAQGAAANPAAEASQLGAPSQAAAVDKSSARSASGARRQAAQEAGVSGAPASASAPFSSCKKFLIKKISNPNLRTFFGRHKRRVSTTQANTTTSSSLVGSTKGGTSNAGGDRRAGKKTIGGLDTRSGGQFKQAASTTKTTTTRTAGLAGSVSEDNLVDNVHRDEQVAIGRGKIATRPEEGQIYDNNYEESLELEARCGKQKRNRSRPATAEKATTTTKTTTLLTGKSPKKSSSSHSITGSSYSLLTRFRSRHSSSAKTLGSPAKLSSRRSSPSKKVELKELRKLADTTAAAKKVTSKKKMSSPVSPRQEGDEDEEPEVDVERQRENTTLVESTSVFAATAAAAAGRDAEADLKSSRRLQDTTTTTTTTISREYCKLEKMSPESRERPVDELYNDYDEEKECSSSTGHRQLLMVRSDDSGGGGQQQQQQRPRQPTSPGNFDETSKSCEVAAKRLRDITAHLEHGSVPRSVLYETLEYAASVLDSIIMDQVSRVSDEEDGDLSEVQSDAVPNEVRKWLETTFTRNSISQKRRTEDKLKFRSVANAIRAGIVVDRIYRRMSASTPFVSQEVSQLLKSIDDWTFDCFHINQVSNGQVLKSVGYELFNRYGLMYKFKIPTTTLKNFLTQIESGYTKHKNPYHNNLHAADVTQTVHYMLWQAGLTNWLTDLEIFATLLAAIIHDYLHTGTTNNFHVMSQSDTALVYNDRAVLENFHISQAFTLMKNEDCNILAGLSKDEYREFRSLVIDMVLATDMSSHFQQIKAMKNILNHAESFNADKSKILSLVIHISDISHPAKEWELHSQWTSLLMEEFFRQGDREKELNLECSPLCDRETTLVAESQLGFIEFIVSPSLEICGDVLDRVHYQMAEANSRPVAPASAKAASVVAAVTTGKTGAGGGSRQATPTSSLSSAPQLAAITAPGSTSDKQPQQSFSASSDKNTRATVASPRQLSEGQDTTSATISDLLEQSSLEPASSSSWQARQSTAADPAVGAGQQVQQQQQQSARGRAAPRQLSASSVSVASSSQSTTGSSGSSYASIFVASETIASNLRKMIASSSASISKKLNKTAAALANDSSSSLASTTNHSCSLAGASLNSSATNQQQQQQHRQQQQQQQHQRPPVFIQQQQQHPEPGGSADHQEERSETVAEFEARQANYRHPVIQCDNHSSSSGAPLAASGGGGFKMTGRLASDSDQTVAVTSGGAPAQHNLDYDDNTIAPNTALANSPGGELLLKRSGTLMASGHASRSAPPLQYFKIQRPWISCLERNKKMWRERALKEAKKSNNNNNNNNNM